jgi:hypothetical protein
VGRATHYGVDKEWVSRMEGVKKEEPSSVGE